MTLASGFFSFAETAAVSPAIPPPTMRISAESLTSSKFCPIITSLLCAVHVKALSVAHALIINNYLDAALLAHCLAISAVCTLVYILENWLFLFSIPSDYVDEASFVAQLTTDTIFWIVLNFVIAM
jgi:hypothetical protein